jgi:hypothetical protein
MSWSNPIPVPGLDQITNIRYNINTSGPNFFTYDLGRPVATTPAAAADRSRIRCPAIPDASLAGQAWGWPIPITAGNRPGLPGRRVRARLTKQDDGHSVLDALISFGWRAEIMAGSILPTSTRRSCSRTASIFGSRMFSHSLVDQSRFTMGCRRAQFGLTSTAISLHRRTSSTSLPTCAGCRWRSSTTRSRTRGRCIART